MVIALGVTLIVLWSLAPLAWLVLVGFLPPVDIGERPPRIDPTRFSFDGYAQLLSDPAFRGSLVNSALAATFTMLICLVVGSLGGYALARIEMPGKRVMLGGALATQMVPGILLVIPVFLVMRTIGLSDSLLSLVLVYTAFLLPYSLWLLRNFFAEVPRSLESAARMDGCTRVGALFRIILPAAAPGVGATAIFLFVSCWNEFLFALVLTVRSAKTATVRLAEVQGQIFGQQDYAMLATAATITIVPVVLVLILLNRYVIRGLTQSTVKG
jgi:multiple sugar transport system permease protein